MPKHTPNYMNEDSPQKKGRIREKKATQNINSGAVWFDPRDLKVKENDENYLVDTKDVSKQKTFQLSLEDVDKFYRQAGSKTPVFLIYMGKYVIKAAIQIAPPRK